MTDDGAHDLANETAKGWRTRQAAPEDVREMMGAERADAGKVRTNTAAEHDAYIAAPHVRALIHEWDGEFVGFCYLLTTAGTTSFAGQRVELKRIVVTAKGRGFGRRAMLDALQQSFGDGATEVWLDVVVGNIPARTLYESLGFRPQPTTTWDTVAGHRVEMVECRLSREEWQPLR